MVASSGLLEGRIRVVENQLAERMIRGVGLSDWVEFNIP